MALSSKYHFELPIYVNGVLRRLSIAHNSYDDKWYHGLIFLDGNLIDQQTAYGPFESNYLAYVNATQVYGELTAWRLLVKRGIV